MVCIRYCTFDWVDGVLAAPGTLHLYGEPTKTVPDQIVHVDMLRATRMLLRRDLQAAPVYRLARRKDATRLSAQRPLQIIIPIKLCLIKIKEPV